MIKLNGVVIFNKKDNKFPNNETYSKFTLELIKEENELFVDFEDDSDLLQLDFITNKIRKQGASNIKLIIPYLPYSRMDREEENMGFSLSYLADFINRLNFNSIETWEVHSSKSLELINNLNNVIKVDKLVDLCKDDNTVIVFPDKGARKRYGNLFNLPVIHFEKKRDFATGNILSIDLVDDLKDFNKTFIIVDDLCSRGGTFIPIINKLKNKDSKVYLCVTHLEENVLTGSLLETGLDKLYTANTRVQHEKVIKGV